MPVHPPKLSAGRDGSRFQYECIPQNRKVAHVEDDSKELLRVAHITRFHYDAFMCHIAFMMWTKRLALMWGRYLKMREHNTVFLEIISLASVQHSIRKIETAVSLTFSKVRIVEYVDRGYTTRPECAYPVKTIFPRFRPTLVTSPTMHNCG